MQFFSNHLGPIPRNYRNVTKTLYHVNFSRSMHLPSDQKRSVASVGACIYLHITLKKSLKMTENLPNISWSPPKISAGASIYLHNILKKSLKIRETLPKNGFLFTEKHLHKLNWGVTFWHFRFIIINTFRWIQSSKKQVLPIN